MQDRIYAITNKGKKLVYVGRTYRSTTERWSEHLLKASQGTSSTKLSEALRHDPGGFEITELEYSETANEAEWYNAYVADGWIMLNEASPNNVAAKKRAINTEWKRQNKNADRIAPTLAENIVTAELKPNAHEMLRNINGRHLWDKYQASVNGIASEQG